MMTSSLGCCAGSPRPCLSEMEVVRKEVPTKPFPPGSETHLLSLWNRVGPVFASATIGASASVLRV